jgi:hypothetical protein
VEAMSKKWPDLVSVIVHACVLAALVVFVLWLINVLG